MWENDARTSQSSIHGPHAVILPFRTHFASLYVFMPQFPLNEGAGSPSSFGSNP